MRALAQELIGLWGPWMSTDRNENISNHEKDMFRNSFPSGEQDRAYSFSGIENVIISASLWCWEWRHVWFGRKRSCLVLLGVALWLSILLWDTAEFARSNKPKQAEHFQIPFKYILPKWNVEKDGLGPHESPLVHIQISASRWRKHFLHVLVSESRIAHPCAAPPLAAQIHSAGLPWCHPPSPRGCQPPCAWWLLLKTLPLSPYLQERIALTLSNGGEI